MFAWSCAANLQLYDEDPGPRQTNVGNRDEPRVVDRHEALVELYARQVLVSLQADEARMLALAENCRQRAATARTLRGGWQAVRARRAAGSPEPWPRAIAALSPWSRREAASVWAVGAELADAAVQMVRDADAAEDGKARARLLASAKHSLTYDVLGGIIPTDVRMQAAADLADTLRRIDESDT